MESGNVRRTLRQARRLKYPFTHQARLARAFSYPEPIMKKDLARYILNTLIAAGMEPVALMLTHRKKSSAHGAVLSARDWLPGCAGMGAIAAS